MKQLNITAVAAEHSEGSIAKSRSKAVKAVIVLAMSVLSTLVVAYVVTLTMVNNNLKEELATANTTIESYKEKNNSLSSRLETVKATNKDLTNDINEMSEVVNDLQDSNDTLIKDNKLLNKENKAYKKREELFNKYEYAIIDEGGSRTDFTYDQIATAEELMEDRGLDPDLLLGVAMVESSGDQTCTSDTSTAVGYCQLLQGTAKFVYEDFAGNGKGTYSHDMAYNGTTNLTIAADYWKYLSETKPSLYSAIQNYRGRQDISGYTSKINEYLGSKGKTVWDCTWP